MRLFWKIFFVIWLGHLTVAFGMTTVLPWLMGVNQHRPGMPGPGFNPQAQPVFPDTDSQPPFPVAGMDAAQPQQALPRLSRRQAELLLVNMVAVLTKEGEAAFKQKFDKQLPIRIVTEDGVDIFGREVDRFQFAMIQRVKRQQPRVPFIRFVQTEQANYWLYILKDEIQAMNAHPGPGLGQEARQAPFADGPAAGQPPMPPGMQRPGGMSLPDSAFERFFLKLRPWMALIISTLSSVFYAWLFAWYLTRPISRLREALTAVAGGDLDTRIAESMGRRNDELADLGVSFDGMAQRLQTAVDGQQRLLHDVSHELRSPLARLQLAIGLLRQQPETLDVSLKRIEQESKRMDALVGELLTLSKLETGGSDFAHEPVMVAELLEDIVNDADFEAQAQQKRVTLCVEVAPELAGNPDMLRRAFENVIRNAIKHSPDAGVINVSILSHVGGWQVSIADQGKGVPEEDLPHLFTPFYRSASQGKNIAGYGLGLAITQQVIRNHGGYIHASNIVSGGLRISMIFTQQDAEKK